VQRSFLIVAAAFVALLAGALFYAARFPVGAPPPVEAPVTQALEIVSHPEFTLPDLDGVERRLSEWDGRHRLLNFWATWCAPCRREIPLLKAFQDEHGEDGFQVIGIAVDFAEDVADYALDAQFNYPVLVGQEDAMAVAETSGVEFIGMPFTMIVAADGELLNAHIGEIHQEELDHIVEVLARLDRGEIDNPTARDELATL
jgi:thiol-disulfide isomerase/thioredoxin